MNLADLQKEAHAIAKDHGWWDEERTFGDLIALVHSELSEALEAYRMYGLEKFYSYEGLGRKKLEGVASELADVVIRVADMAEHYGARLSVPPSFPHLYTFGEWITHVHYCVALAGRKHWDDDYRWCEDLEDVVGLIQRMAAHYGIDLDAAIAAKMEYNRHRKYRHGGKALVNNQDQPYAYLARPYWERDDVKIFPDLESLVTRCDDGLTFPGPLTVCVIAVYRDGREVKVPREVYSVSDPVSREQAEEFVRWRSERLADPDLPFEEQVAQYIDNPPWRWKTSGELASSDAVPHGGKAL